LNLLSDIFGSIVSTVEGSFFPLVRFVDYTKSTMRYEPNKVVISEMAKNGK